METPPDDSAATRSPSSSNPSSSASAPNRRRALIAVSVALLLVAGGVAAYVFQKPGGIGHGVVSEKEMRAALASFAVLVSNTSSPEAWGLQGTVSTGVNSSVEIQFLWNPASHAYEVQGTTKGGTQSVTYLKRQKDTIINVESGGESYIGRDEDPSTLTTKGRSQITLPNLTDVHVTKVRSDTVRGRAATHFWAQNDTAEVEVWVYHQAQVLARLKIQQGSTAVDFVVLHGEEVRVQVNTTAPRRAAFELDSTETTARTSETSWINGTVSVNHTEEVRLAEVELRLVNGTGKNATTLASLALNETVQTNGSTTLRFLDADGDGLVSAGDQYSASFSSSLTGVHLVFFDVWAGANEGSTVPTLPSILSLALLLGAGWIVRRRRGGSDYS